MTHAFLRSSSAVAVMLLALQSFGQNKGVAVNNDGRAPDPTAILDVSSNYTPIGTAIQKGMLIPRMTYTQRTNPAGQLGPVAGLPQGLTVYQTDVNANFPPGFYVVEYGQWFRIDNGANGWSINGNNTTNPVNDFFGTRDDQDLVFKTNNNQVMRVEGTPATRYVHVGNLTTVPNEQLDVQGAIRVYNPSPGTWSGTNPNTRFAATNTQGTILFRPSGTGAPGDSLQATYTPAGFPTQANRDIVMWNGHWGNIDGTAPGNLGANDAHAGGWRRMENEYEERFTKAYTQQGEATCVAGNTELSFGSSLSSGALGAAELLMNPFKYDVPQRRYRCQYLFLKNELDVEANQLVPGGNPAATGGLCAGSAITQIGFYVNQAIAANNPQRTLQVTVTVKHVPLGVNDLTFGFDNSVDPLAGCYTNAALPAYPAAGAAGWRTFTISPFTWDGQRNVLVEIAVTAAGGGGVAAGGIDVRYSVTTGANLTYSAYAGPPYGVGFPCTPGTPTSSVCGPLQTATGLGNCNTTGGAFGASVNRPVIQFSGQVTSAPAAVSGQNAFIWYRGGLIAESTTSPNPWGKQTTPYFAFRGPGTISAENGVYDNQVRLNDHVFDRAFDGAVKPADAAEFGTSRIVSIDEMADQTRRDRHLPTIKGRDSWNAERGFSLGDLTNQLWTTAETQALYVTELNDRLNVLELLSNDRPLAPEESDLARRSIHSMNAYTDAEKSVLLQTIEQRTVTTKQR